MTSHAHPKFPSQLSDTDGLQLLHYGPPPQRHMCENEAALYTDATTYVEHVPLKEGGQLLQSTDHLFQAALCSQPPQQLAAISCQDRTQRCSLPVKSIIVKHGCGTTSAGSYKSENDALECHQQKKKKKKKKPARFFKPNCFWGF